MLTDHELLRYSRHILLSEIDLEGQLAIKSAKILVIGCGGLGNAVIPLLVAAGIGHLTIVDHDVVDLSNLQRQIHFTTADLTHSKAHALKAHMQALNPEVWIDAIAQKADDALLMTLAKDVDMIIDCTDNFTIRQANNRIAHHYRIPLISGSAVRMEGQLAVYDFRSPESGCYHCLFDGAHSDDGNCALLGVFAPILQIIGAMQAQEALKILVGMPVMINRLRVYNGATCEWQTFKFSKNPTCPICSSNEEKYE
ncbi:HesA/MoeB/ThiF family protein [Wohlfahrtiimonas chitiniclastica]|uniref:HesA/MoeB/ThiF family protein n=1 Tax=Wohlfahrtiimonas chitiniclastica TaxID=400946 RepID=UPI0007B413D5|nr:HesA/MoeB/ThiF family protein [Wohlfahrtiimonas chitiniclastica]KZS22680.1 molybdopterin-synthase adenylyltransferase [Wohlfahrtiimonas chitiniclastica]WHR55136.1 HesA/MoeB/ThiF family protein [Wohlfahrtiimonas chitiniclastica]